MILKENTAEVQNVLFGKQQNILIYRFIEVTLCAFSAKLSIYPTVFSSKHSFRSVFS